jgi:hypothetical protein
MLTEILTCDILDSYGGEYEDDSLLIAMKMQAVHTSETLSYFNENTWSFFPECVILKLNSFLTDTPRSRGSSVNTDRTTGRSGFDSLCVQTGSGAHPASCTMGTRGPFSGSKAPPGLDAYHSPHLVLRSRMSRSYTSSSPKNLHGV